MPGFFKKLFCGFNGSSSTGAQLATHDATPPILENKCLNIALIGDSNTGKSTFINQLKGKSELIEGLHSKEEGTSVSFEKNLRYGPVLKKDFTITCHETSLGHDVSENEFDIVFIFFSVDNKKSFKHAFTHLEKMKERSIIKENTISILLAAKADLPPEEWKITRDKIRARAIDHKLNWYFISDKGGKYFSADQMVEKGLEQILYKHRNSVSPSLTKETRPDSVPSFFQLSQKNKPNFRILFQLQNPNLLRLKFADKLSNRDIFQFLKTHLEVVHIAEVVKERPFIPKLKTLNPNEEPKPAFLYSPNQKLDFTTPDEDLSTHFLGFIYATEDESEVYVIDRKLIQRRDLKSIEDQEDCAIIAKVYLSKEPIEVLHFEKYINRDSSKWVKRTYSASSAIQELETCISNYLNDKSNIQLLNLRQCTSTSPEHNFIASAIGEAHRSKEKGLYFDMSTEKETQTNESSRASYRN